MKRLIRYESQIKEIIGYLDKLDSISLAEKLNQLHSKKEFSELRKDHAESFKGDVLQLARKIKGWFCKGSKDGLI